MAKAKKSDPATPPKRRGRPPKAARTAFAPITVPEVVTSVFSAPDADFDASLDAYIAEVEKTGQIIEAMHLALMRLQRITATLRLATIFPVGEDRNDEALVLAMSIELLDGVHEALSMGLAELKTTM